MQWNNNNEVQTKPNTFVIKAGSLNLTLFNNSVKDIDTYLPSSFYPLIHCFDTALTVSVNYLEKIYSSSYILIDYCIL